MFMESDYLPLYYLCRSLSGGKRELRPKVAELSCSRGMLGTLRMLAVGASHLP